MHRLDLARKLGCRWPNGILPFAHGATKRLLISCRCQKHWFIMPERGELTNTTLYHLERLFDCECIPPLAECIAPDELKQLLLGLPLDALHELAATLPPERESPRQVQTDEGSMQAREERTYKKNDSAADIASQSTFGEARELACALHADCAGHEPPTGDAA